MLRYEASPVNETIMFCRFFAIAQDDSNSNGNTVPFTVRNNISEFSYFENKNHAPFKEKKTPS